MLGFHDGLDVGVRLANADDIFAGTNGPIELRDQATGMQDVFPADDMATWWLHGTILVHIVQVVLILEL